MPAHFSIVVRNSLDATFGARWIVMCVCLTPGGYRHSNILCYNNFPWNTWHFWICMPIAPSAVLLLFDAILKIYCKDSTFQWRFQKTFLLCPSPVFVSQLVTFAYAFLYSKWLSKCPLLTLKVCTLNFVSPCIVCSTLSFSKEISYLYGRRYGSSPHITI